jgi:DNA repair exonuclease SbcCD ATPase subunit
MIMTQDKALKAAIRARMAEAGEPYSVARHVILSDGPVGGERGVPQASAGPDAAADQADDYFALYLREAREAGVPEEELHAMAAAHHARERLRIARAGADRAEELAEEAEEAAEMAEERAGLAEEAADLAEEWADPEEQQAARRRAERMQDEAERAREVADRAREEADAAEERAELAEEQADQAEDESDNDEDPALDWSWGRPPRPPRPPKPPRAARPQPAGRGWGFSALDRLEQRYEEMQDKAEAFLDRLGFDRDPG